MEIINGYVTAEGHEKFLDRLAESEAMCNDKIRWGQCRKDDCRYCEKMMRLNECKKELDSYSLLLLGDKIERRTASLAAARPKAEEIDDYDKRMRQAELRGLKEGYKRLNHDSFWYGGGIIAVAACLFVLIVFPLFALL